MKTKKENKMATEKKKPVVVTTEYRGVFFGYVEDSKEAPVRIELSDVRNCIYWSTSIKGVLGLAATGPNSDCKIGPSVPTATIWKVTGIFGCTSEAAEAWEKSAWK